MGPALSALGDRLHQGLAAGLDLVVPPRCLMCGATIARGGDLCSACWRRLSFIDGACCALCGLPFETPVTGDQWCGPCLADRPGYRTGRAALVYDDASRELVLPFKHADRLDMAPGLSRMLLRAGGDMVRRADVITAVPLHRWRLLSRRYNQAAVLAKALARLTDKPLIADLVERIRATPSQGGLGPRERRANVRGAFRVPERYVARVKAQEVLLIDDVHTTGATLDEAARVLLAAGARAVDVLTLARVVRPEVV